MTAATKTRIVVGRKRANAATEMGPKVWTRFLTYDLDCAPPELNEQLPLPIEPGEVFVFGRSPEPIPKAYAPKLFQTIYDEGTTPYGNYAVEPHDPDRKFNLYERVSQRFPQSRPWILNDLRPFLGIGWLYISDSASHLLRLLQERDAMLVHGHSLAGWVRVDPDGPKRAEAEVLARIAEAGTPDAVLLLYSALHAMIWEDRYSRDEIAERIAICRHAATSFAASPVLARNPDDDELRCRLEFLLGQGIEIVEMDGKRSMVKGPSRTLMPIPRRVLPVPRTQSCLDAMRCLNAAGDHAWEELHSPPPDSFCPTGWDVCDSQVRAAGEFLVRASVELLKTFTLGEAGKGRNSQAGSPRPSRNSHFQ